MWLVPLTLEPADVPVAVKVLYCDYNPRIVVQFADASKNVWYPANEAANQSKEFLAIALAAKSSGQRFYCYGTGDPAELTTYCISVSAWRVHMFGLQ